MRLPGIVLVLGLVLAAAVPAGWALDWRSAGADGLGFHYIDVDSIQRHGPVVTFWTMTRHDALPAQRGVEVIPNLGTIKAVCEYKRLNCQRGTIQTTRRRVYDATGRVIQRQVVTEPPYSIAPPSVDVAYRRLACVEAAE